MRFEIRPGDPRIRDLVVALDRDRQPYAETWRQVGEAAWRLGLPRPGYHLVRELTARSRRIRAARRATRRAALGVVEALHSPYVVRTRQALERLAEAKSRERLVLDQHKVSRLVRLQAEEEALLEDEGLREDDP
jgi:hypothetical protein